MLDYAHILQKSLENILQSAKEYTLGKVICVFGCGGDRDSRKDQLWEKLLEKLADYTIVTSDNPRTEEPEEIVKEIEKRNKENKRKI